MLDETEYATYFTCAKIDIEKGVFQCVTTPMTNIDEFYSEATYFTCAKIDIEKGVFQCVTIL